MAGGWGPVASRSSLLELLEERSSVPTACPGCGNPVSVHSAFCRSCGTRLAPDVGRVRVDQPPAVLPSIPPPYAQPPAPANPTRRRAFPRLVLLGAAALLLVLVLSAGGICLYLPWESGRWDLLPSMVASIWENGWSGRLQPVVESPQAQTPALDSSPAPGIRLTAPAGALDRPRQFRATPFTEDQLTNLVQVAPDSIIAPVAGYDIDGGMSESDLFNGQVKLAFDLQTLNIPKELWGSVSVARLAPDGTLQHMVTNRDGSAVSCQIRHNNPYLLLIMILGLKSLYLTDQVVKGALDNTLGCDLDPYFRVEWPKSLPLRETAERRALDEKFKQLWDRYKPPEAQKDDSGVVSRQFKLYMSDPEVQKAYATFRDIEWKKKNYLPVQVAHVVDALQKAGNYIFEVRGFRKRGERIEVHCLTPWDGNPEVYGYSKDGHFTYPYIHINLDKVPATDTGADQTALDNLRVTAAHELFHVCQKEYYNWTKYANPGQIWSGGVNHWFMEATALVFEEEAKDYYLGKNWNASFPLTADNLYVSQTASPGASRKQLQAYFKVPMDSGGNETESGHRGYAVSQFLLDLRRRYYSRNADAFLPAVLDAFGTFRSGPIDALIKATSGSNTVFGADYLVFCAEQATNIFDQYPPSTREESLNPAEPLIRWPLVGPISSPCLIARIRGLGGPDLQQCKVLVRANSIKELGQLRRQEPSGDFRSITGSSLLLSRADMGSQASQTGVRLQRIETYTSPPTTHIAASNPMLPEMAQTEILLLAPPREMPKIQFDNERQIVRVEIPPSVLRKAGQVKDYRLTLYRLGNGRPLTFTTEGRSDVEIAWRQIAEAEPPTLQLPPDIRRRFHAHGDPGHGRSVALRDDAARQRRRPEAADELPRNRARACSAQRDFA